MPDPHALYPVRLTRAWARVSTTTFWNLELVVMVRGMETSLPQLLAQATGNAMQVIVAKKMRVPLDDAEFKDLNVVQPGDYLVAINGVDVDNLAVSELVDRLDAAAMASLESPCTLLFARHDYNDVKALRPFLSTFPEYGDVVELHYGNATWFYNESGILFANHYVANNDAIADFFQPTTESTQERAFVAMYEETLLAKHKLAKTLNLAVERIWEHFCDIVFLEHLEREMQLPQLPHLNLREDARHMLYSRRYTAAPPWPFQLKWQSSRQDYSLKSLVSASTTTPRGIAVVATSSESNIAAGDVLVGINHVFLTTSALTFQKQWRCVQATTSLARPTTFFFLRFIDNSSGVLTPRRGRSQYRKIVSAIHASTRCWQVPWTLFDYTLLDVVETYLPSRFPPRLAKLVVLGAESNAWETHAVDNVVWYNHDLDLLSPYSNKSRLLRSSHAYSTPSHLAKDPHEATMVCSYDCELSMTCALGRAGVLLESTAGSDWKIVLQRKSNMSSLKE
ncbi:hypothetical protein AC1031_016918 [Aphanomyces cochlioides]|nr:hypothetical protein AC1031_016918 [Aphanomyces cochlioides]